MEHGLAKPLRVLTWHVHGNYLWYLTRAKCDFFLPVKPTSKHGYSGRSGWPFGSNVHDVPAEDVRKLDFDCILFQSRENYTEDQVDLLTEAQRRLPRIYLEHDTPGDHPIDQLHCVDDPNVLLVHVTHFNALMWNNGCTPVRVIEHGVPIPDQPLYTGELARGITVINNLRQRGRRLGADVFERARAEVPIDLVGMDAEAMNGVGEVKPPLLPAFESRYRFFFHPVRWTSLGLAVLEAMALGMPVVGLAATELVRVIENGVSGYIDTDVDKLIERMNWLLREPAEARRLGEGAHRVVMERYHIDRFAREWEETFAFVSK
jgi:hypothetical protein